MNDAGIHMVVYETLKHYFWHFISLAFMIWGFSMKMRKMPLSRCLPYVILSYFFAYFAPLLWNWYKNF